jgi:hypothetical protein
MFHRSKASGERLALLGSITFALVPGYGADLAWTMRLRDFWAQWIGAPPF